MKIFDFLLFSNLKSQIVYVKSTKLYLVLLFSKKKKFIIMKVKIIKKCYVKNYFFSYQSADGTQRQESGGLKYPSAPGLLPVMSVQGSYSSITPEGIVT